MSILLSLWGRAPADAIKKLGRPRGVGADNAFLEWASGLGGFFIRYEAGRAVKIVVTLRMPRPTPEAALAALGLKPGGRLAFSDAFERRWQRLSGLPEVCVRSSDGRRWDTLEVRPLSR